MHRIGDLILRITRFCYRNCNKWLNPPFASKGEYEFINRSKKAKNMMIVLAGYQPYYFDAVFERVESNIQQFNEDIDICICCSNAPTEAVGKLKRLAEKNDWSLLFLKKNRVTQIQNTAISLFPQAEWIYKIDEDIILPDNYFSSLKQAYITANLTLPYRVGFAGPVLNINAFGTPSFLKTIGQWEEFEKRFGKYQVGGTINTPEDYIHNNKEWAKFIWERTIPFDKVAAEVAQNKAIEICPIRFSIGAILIERSFLEKNGFFPVFRSGGMGQDEKYLCDVCIEGMYSIVVASGILVGHLGFGQQKEVCKEFFFEHESEIRKYK